MFFLLIVANIDNLLIIRRGQKGFATEGKQKKEYVPKQAANSKKYFILSSNKKLSFQLESLKSGSDKMKFFFHSGAGDKI